MAFANSSEGSSWLTAFPGSAAGANTGMFSSLKVLSNGNVGIAYRDNTLDGGGLFYISSTNNAATAWNAGILLHSGSFVGLYASLFVNPVTSFPMIAHFDIENNDIYFVKATDVSGTAWGTSSMIEQDGGSDVVLSMSSASGGRAIIAFLRSNINSGTQKLFLKVANEADPLTWGASFQVSAVDEFVSGFAINMLDGSHLPAIAYSTYRDAFNLAGPNFFETYVIYSSTVAGNGAWSSCPHSSATPVETTACIASIIDNDSAYHRVSKLAWVNLLPGTKSVCATPYVFSPVLCELFFWTHRVSLQGCMLERFWQLLSNRCW